MLFPVHRRYARSLLLSLGALLVLAGCGGGGDADELAASAPGAATSAAEPSPSAAVGDTTANSEPKTLSEYLSAAGGGGTAARGGFGVDEDEALEQQRLVQQAIQVCMQAQGFVYVPEDVGDGLRIFLATENQGVDPADYAATQGFGISTRFDAIFEGEFELDDSTDPNEEHLATLSEGEADAWQLALRGQPPERNEQGQLVDPSTGEPVGRPGQASGGCQLEAQTEVRGTLAELGALEDELALLSDRIDSDPRITEIRREWIDCMLAEGFDYDDEAEARDDITAQVRPLLRSFFASGDNGDAAGTSQGTQGGRGAQGGGNLIQAIAGLQLTPEQDAELEALQDLERSIAVASLTCQGDTAQEIAEITATYEAEFIEVNRSALEGLDS